MAWRSAPWPRAYFAARPARRTSDTSPLTLWYRQPAEQWTEALPIGNGRLGAMIFGGVARERLQLNEDTLYAGGPYDPSNPDALAALPQVRALIAEGKYADAQNLAQEKMMARPIRMPSYQTVGDLILSFGASAYAQDYRRELNLDTACARVRFARDGVTFTRESFASAVDQVIVTRITADRPGALDFRASFETPMPGAVAIDDGHLVLNGRNVAQQGIDGEAAFPGARGGDPAGRNAATARRRVRRDRRGLGARARRHCHELPALR